MIAIHERENSFSVRWTEYCMKNSLNFISVNIYDSDIIEHLRSNCVSILLVHVSIDDFKTRLISRSILSSIEKTGIKVFPDCNTFWHFDDKISQKYVFEALNIPHAPMHVFFDRNEASKWLSEATFPLVFKLRAGAGSSNVHLVKTNKEANEYLVKMFNKGLSPVPSATNDFTTKLKKHSKKRDWTGTLKRLPSTIKNILYQKSMVPNEKNYFLVQDYLPGNDYDTRVTILGDKAFAFRRFNRKNDFKASGSGDIDYSYSEIDKRAVLIAFQAADKSKSQSMAFDFLYNSQKEPVIIEMSYSFVPSIVYNCGGYWDRSLKYYKTPCWPEDVIIEHVLGINF